MADTADVLAIAQRVDDLDRGTLRNCHRFRGHAR
jgi:hypothetical protein